VARATLRPGERVLDIGTGTGNGAAAAVGEGRRVVGVDAAAGMLQIARARVPDAEFVEAEFAALPFEDAAFDAILAVHAINFAADLAAVLREWRRVATEAARLSVSFPGPRERLPVSLYGEVWARYGLRLPQETPMDAVLAAAEAAGWRVASTDADPTIEVVLADVDAFHRWRSTGSRGRATAGWPPDRLEALDADMLAVTPRGPAGELRIPFGALFLTVTA
jgi:ubiquinone/menaquinone biosynthesis C-methylase UbiE